MSEPSQHPRSAYLTLPPELREMIWRQLPALTLSALSRTCQTNYSEVKKPLAELSTFIDSADTFSIKELLVPNPSPNDCTARQDEAWRNARNEQRAMSPAFTCLIRDPESQRQERRRRGDRSDRYPYDSVLAWGRSKDTSSRQNSMHFVVNIPYDALVDATTRVDLLQTSIVYSFADSDIDYLSITSMPRGFDALFWLGRVGLEAMGKSKRSKASTVVVQLRHETSLEFDDQLYARRLACSIAPDNVVVLTGLGKRRDFQFAERFLDDREPSQGGKSHLEILCKRLALVSTKFKKGKTRLSLGPIDRWDLTKFGMHADTLQEEVNVTIGGTIERFRTDETRRTCPGWDFIESTDVARDRLDPESRGRYKGVLDE